MPDLFEHPPASPKDAARGVGMGLADVVPGVSGGTIALALGIHPRLVDVLHNIQFGLLRLVPGVASAQGRAKIAAEWRARDFSFLAYLLVGIAVGILVGSQVLVRLMESQPVLLAAFFFGLIVASSRVPWRLMTRRSWPEAVAFVVAVAAAMVLTVARPVQAPEALWFLPIAGAIAVAAMLLPGVSGSFLLLLMGLYEPVVQAVSTFDLVVILLFGVGAVVGLLTTARVLHRLLLAYRNPTLAALTGLMIGSVGRVWPYRSEDAFAAGQPVLPEFGVGLVGALAVALLGAGVVFLLERADPAAKRH